MQLIEYVSFKADDGFTLTGTAYRPAPGSENGDAVFIASAMGVGRGYYHKFAHFLMEQGFKVLTFDYRGIGASWPEGDKGDDFLISHWGELDIPAAINWTKDNFTPQRLLMVGHSVGGQVLCLVPQNSEIDRIMLIGSQLGDMSYWDGLQKLKVMFFWKIALPLLVKLTGKLPGWLLGSEDLPKGIALQWQRWGTTPGYILSEGPHVQEGFSRIESPMMFYSFSDDDFAPLRPVEKLMACYQNAPQEHRHISPKNLKVKSIGHFGFFKSRFSKNLWPEATRWLKV